MTVLMGGLLVVLAVSCTKDRYIIPEGQENVTAADETGLIPIVFNQPQFDVENNVTDTKATAVTSVTSFKASCVTGTFGTSESAVWTNVSFTGTASSCKGGKYWPYTSDYPSGGYKFYATNYSTIAFTSTGATVSPSTNSIDVVVAYNNAPTYCAKNALNFNHIYARLTDVTVAAATGYTISSISITITPKVGGTYNIYTGRNSTDATGWSGTVSGSVTTISNASAGTKSNDIYLVPGTYTVTAGWTASTTNGDWTRTYSGVTQTVNLVKGHTNKLSITLGGNATEIEFSTSVTPWVTSDPAITPSFSAS